MTGRSEVRTAVAMPWWAWPTALSLDAPVVAVAWQLIFARAFEVPLSWAVPVTLFLSVWLIYVADRLLDGLTLNLNAQHSRRHALYLHHRPSFTLVWAWVAFGTLLLVVTQLPAATLWPGLGIAAAVGLYGAGIHVWARLSVSKELLVGLIFAAAISFPVWLGAPSWPLLLATLLLAGLCSLNCLLIAVWEAKADEAQNQASFVRTVPGTPKTLPVLLGAFGVLVLLGGVWLPTSLTGCLGVSGLGLALLSGRNNVPAEGLRVLADVALTTPLLLLIYG